MRARATALTSRFPRSLAARCSQADSTAPPPSVKTLPLSPSEQAAKEAAQHEELEGPLATVATERPLEPLAAYLAAPQPHHAPDAARAGRLRAAHAASHNYLSVSCRSALAPLSTAHAAAFFVGKAPK